MEIVNFQRRRRRRSWNGEEEEEEQEEEEEKEEERMSYIFEAPEISGWSEQTEWKISAFGFDLWIDVAPPAVGW